MSAAKPARPEEAARLVALYDAPGYFDVQQAHAALFLLQRLDDGAHLGLDLKNNREDAELAGWCRVILLATIEEALGTIERKIIETVKSSATVPPGPVARRSGTRATARTP